MKRYKPYAVILFVAIAQIVFIYQNDKLFWRHMNERLDMMERHMAEDGVQGEQVRHISSALRSVTLKVSSYVHGQSTQFVIFNAMVLLILVKGRSKDELSL